MSSNTPNERFVRKSETAACEHEWVDQPLRYEQRQMTAYVGDDPEPQEVTGTMVYDERCAKCGIESGWPS